MRNQRNLWERLVERIPGYGGYKDRERQRDADRLLRQHIADLLDEARRGLLSSIQRQITQTGMAGVADLDRVARLLEQTASQVRYADSGYVGLFGQIKFDHNRLEQVYALDTELADLAAAIQEAAHRDAGDPAPAVEAACRAFSARLADRRAILEGARP